MSPQLPDWCKPFMHTKSRFKIAYGGRGSSKSWSIALMILLIGRKQRVRILCTREIQLSIKASVYQLFFDLIFRFGWQDEWKMTGLFFTHKTTGTYISFAGLKNNPESIKSSEGVDLVWIEEAQTISEVSMRQLIPTVRKPGSEIWMSMNPRYETDYVYRRFVVGIDQDNVLAVPVNYTDNPFFPAVLTEEMEYDKADNYAMYLHTWEGKVRPYGERPLFSEGVLQYGSPNQFRAPDIYGLDLSYSGNNALIGVHMSDDKRDLFIDSGRVRSHVPLNKMADWLGDVDNTIVVDSARPEIIRLLRDSGYSVRHSKKGRGSVLSGADRMARFRHVYVAPGLDVVYNEFARLGFNDKEELAGERDCFDAARYGMERLGGFRVLPWDALERGTA